MDGHKVTLENKKPVTQPGEVQRVKEEGMPKYGMPSDFGDLLVTYRIKNPDTLDDGQRVLLK